MTRLIKNMVSDVGRLTRFSEPVAHRICFLRGAREGILDILSLRTAPSRQFLWVYTNIMSTKDLVKELKSKEIPAEQSQLFKNIVEVKIIPRLIPTDKGLIVNEEVEGAEKLSEEYIQKNNLKMVTVRRDAAIATAMGKDVVSTDIVEGSGINPGDEVVVIDKYKTVVGVGIAQMSEEEAKRSPGRIAIKIRYSLYDVPDYTGLKAYRRGAFSVMSLPRILAIQALLAHQHKETPNVLIEAQDTGDVAAAIYHSLKGEGEYLILARNDGHASLIRDSMKRLNLGENVKVIKDEIEKLAKRRRRQAEKFNYVFFEPVNSRTGERPSFFSEIEEKTIISYHRSQFQSLRSLNVLTKVDTPIVYMTHSLDPTENQEVISLGLKQGSFELSNDRKYLKMTNDFPSDIDIMPDIPTSTQADSAKITEILQTPSYKDRWIEVRSLRDDADAGFICVLINKLKRRESTSLRRR